MTFKQKRTPSQLSNGVQKTRSTSAEVVTTFNYKKNRVVTFRPILTDIYSVPPTDQIRTLPNTGFVEKMLF